MAFCSSTGKDEKWNGYAFSKHTFKFTKNIPWRKLPALLTLMSVAQSFSNVHKVTAVMGHRFRILMFFP